MHINTISHEKVSMEYPMLGTSNSGLVVLFLKEKEGTVIDPGDTVWKVGANVNFWDMARFQRLNGSVTLSND